MFVCICKALTEAEARQLLNRSDTDPEDEEAVVAALGLDDEDACCGRCRLNVPRLLSLLEYEPAMR